MKKAPLYLAGVIFSLMLMGCQSMSSNETYGTLGGAAVGGALGYAVGGSTGATVGGAAAGALIGNRVGKGMDD